MGMSRRRRVSLWLARAALVSALGLELLALHFPAPSGVRPAAREEVRGAWTLAGGIARAAAAFVPDRLADAVEPLVDDKTIHFLLFLPLGALSALERRLKGASSARVAALLVLGLAVYAALGEASQVLGGRIADIGDFVANVLGAVVGVLGVGLATRSLRPPRRAVAEASKGETP